MVLGSLDHRVTPLSPLDARRRAASRLAETVAGVREPARIVLCHPAPLAGQAIAATLRRTPGVSVVMVVATVNDLVRELSRGWDVALVSESLGGDLPELLQALVFRGLGVPVVVMTTDADIDLAAQHLEWGAAGSVDVRRPVADFVHAVHLAACDMPVVDDRIRTEIVERLETRAAHREHARRLLHALSGRERQVIESLARGTGVADIASTLHLSPHTIRACIRTLGPKLKVTGQLQIAAMARELMSAANQPAHSRYLQRVRASGVLPMTS